MNKNNQIIKNTLIKLVIFYYLFKKSMIQSIRNILNLMVYQNHSLKSKYNLNVDLIHNYYANLTLLKQIENLSNKNKS